MHPEIEKLIQLAIADGQVSEKERAVIMKKATTLGEDIDEVELILDGELALANKLQNSLNQNTIPAQSNKEGNVKKCPSCGAPVQSFSLKCDECGHEFRNTESSQSIKEFYKQLKAAKIDERSTVISNFPIPNNKEDLIEFITLSIGNSRGLDDEERNVYIKNAFTATYKPELHYRESEINAWQSKSEAAIMKAKLLFSSDEDILGKIRMYETQFFGNKNYKQKQRSKKFKYLIIFFVVYVVFMIILLLSM